MHEKEGVFPLSGPLSSDLLKQPSFESTVLGVRHMRLNLCSFTRYVGHTKSLISQSPVSKMGVQCPFEGQL